MKTAEFCRELWVGEVGVIGALVPKGSFSAGRAVAKDVDPPVDWGACAGGEAGEERASRPNKSSAADLGMVGAGSSNAGAVGTAAGLTWCLMLGGIRLGGKVAGNESRPSRLPRCCRIRYIATANSSLVKLQDELMSARSQI